jgi:hypothetical protein
MNLISRIALVTDAEAAQMVDPDTLADLAERLTSMPVEAAAATHAPGGVTWYSPRRRRRLLIAIPAVAALAVTALLVTSLGVVTSSPGGPARHPGEVPNPIGWNGKLYPLGPPGSGMAERTTVAGAQAAVGYPVPVPSTAAASRANLTQVWVSSTRHIPRKWRQVALVFDKGKVDILMHRATYRSALHYFHAFVAERSQNGGVTAEIGQVNGRPALVIWPGTDYSHSNPSAVSFWRHGVFISIYGNARAYGTHTLLAVAESMRTQ